MDRPSSPAPSEAEVVHAPAKHLTVARGNVRIGV